MLFRSVYYERILDLQGSLLTIEKIFTLGYDNVPDAKILTFNAIEEESKKGSLQRYLSKFQDYLASYDTRKELLDNFYYYIKTDRDEEERKKIFVKVLNKFDVLKYQENLQILSSYEQLKQIDIVEEDDVVTVVTKIRDLQAKISKTVVKGQLVAIYNNNLLITGSNEELKEDTEDIDFSQHGMNDLDSKIPVDIRLKLYRLSDDLSNKELINEIIKLQVEELKKIEKADADEIERLEKLKKLFEEIKNITSELSELNSTDMNTKANLKTMREQKQQINELTNQINELLLELKDSIIEEIGRAHV